MYPLEKQLEASAHSPGELISQARKRAGLTEREMVRRLGTDQVTYKAYENNIVKPASSVLLRITHLLDIDSKEIEDAYVRYWQEQKYLSRANC